ncbi:efflux transporter outer membrane subunit [Litorimonas cladophorae]|nr:efflux transporter outer membrane subunit [Litorimonas cladophorae]
MRSTCDILGSLRHAASGGVIVLLLSGCASIKMSPEPTVVAPQLEANADVEPPQDWVVPAPDALPTTDWVRTFPDTILIELVDEALRENTNIGAAYARLESAIAREKVSQSARLPSVGATGGLSRTERANEFIPDSTAISIGLNASWEPDFWGRVSDNINASELETEASSIDVAGARLSIAGSVAQTWFGLIEARLLTDLSQREVETQERALRLTERRFQSGVSGSQDVRLVRSSLAQAEANKASRLQRMSDLSRQLEVLLTRYPASELDASVDLPELPELEGVGSPTFILTQRPDLIAAERRMAAQGIQIDLAKKALLPSLSLTGSTSAAGGGLGSFFDIDALVASLVSNISAPIFQGGRLRANIDLQEAVLKQQLQSYIGAVLNAYLDVENALYAEGRLEERENALRVSVDEAFAAEQRLEQRYIEGLATILQLLDAQSRRISSEGQLISARAERLQNRVRLHVALGGGAYGDVPPDALPAFLRD